MSASRDKGTAAETAIVRWARLNGFPWADRQPLRGRDQGDITLCPGVIIEAKNHARTGVAIGPSVLRLWLRQTEVERDAAGADHGILVVKRAGTADVGRWAAYLPLHRLAGVLADTQADRWWSERGHAYPVSMDLAALARLLRVAGYGHPLDEEHASS